MRETTVNHFTAILVVPSPYRCQCPCPFRMPHCPARALQHSPTRTRTQAPHRLSLLCRSPALCQGGAARSTRRLTQTCRPLRARTVPPVPLPTRLLQISSFSCPSFRRISFSHRTRSTPSRSGTPRCTNRSISIASQTKTRLTIGVNNYGF